MNLPSNIQRAPRSNAPSGAAGTSVSGWALLPMLVAVAGSSVQAQIQPPAAPVSPTPNAPAPISPTSPRTPADRLTPPALLDPQMRPLYGIYTGQLNSPWQIQRQIPSAANNWLLSGATAPRTTSVTLADGRRFDVIAVRSLTLFERHYRDSVFESAAYQTVHSSVGGFGQVLFGGGPGFGGFWSEILFPWYSNYYGLNAQGPCDPAGRKNRLAEEGVDRNLLSPEQATERALRDRAQFEMTAQSAAAFLLSEAAQQGSVSFDTARIEAARVLDRAADEGDNTVMHRALAAILRATRRDSEAGVLAFSDLLRADPTVAFIRPPNWMIPTDRGGWVGVGSALASEAKANPARAADWHLLAAYMLAQNPSAGAALAPNASRQLVAEASLARRGIERQLQDAIAAGAPAALIDQLKKTWCGTSATTAPAPAVTP